MNKIQKMFNDACDFVDNHNTEVATAALAIGTLALCSISYAMGYKGGAEHERAWVAEQIIFKQFKK